MTLAGSGARRYVAAVAADLTDPLVPVLLVGAAASAVLGSTTDALLVSAVSVANAAMSGAQRAHAEGVLARLIERNVLLARVVTDDGVQVRRADTLRPGDVVELGAQDVVPADARLLRADTLEVDEATLTGESAPVTKRVEPTPAAELGDRDCMVYEGTTVLAGTARAVVVATGEATVAGRAAVVAQAHSAGAVGVQARLGELTRLALPLTGLSGLAVAALASLRGAPARSALGSGVAVAVAAVPEGLPLVATVAQVAAARRLARLGVLVRSSRVVEALGRADVVCFDKTGTLTEGRLVLRAVTVPDPAGRWRAAPMPAPGTAAGHGGPTGAGARILAVAAAACPAPEGRVAHATDRAVLEAAAGRPELASALTGERVDEIPFETARGYAATLLRTPDGPVLAVKGAPEVLLGLVELDAPRLAAARAAAGRLARQGLRVLAVAESSPGSRPESAGDLSSLRLLGFVGIADTPRPSATPGVRRLLDAGLRVVVVTGDHPVTAAAIAREVGVPDADRVVTGAQLERLGDEGYAAQVGAASVFARLSPEQKVRLVTTLQRLGKVVVMTGDGTNDAAAIRAADVGVAVRGRGTAAATGAADLLLTDAEVTRLADAVLEGRRMWRSVTDAVSVLVGGNAGEVAFTLLGTAIAGQAPLRPRQLLLVNLLTDMAPAMALAVRSREDLHGGPGESRPNGGPDAVSTRWLTGSLRRMLVVRGATTTAGATLAWLVGRYTGTPRRASTMGLLALVTTQLGQTLMLAGRDPLVIVTAVASMLVLAVLVQTPILARLFGCRPVGPVGWSVVLASATLATSAAWLYERRRRRSLAPARPEPPARRGVAAATPRSVPAGRGAEAGAPRVPVGQAAQPRRAAAPLSPNGRSPGQPLGAPALGRLLAAWPSASVLASGPVSWRVRQPVTGVT
ncbi:cation-translocating P-type ATPase [Frankia sp. CN6]|uniref:Cation-translocating P-type ATPase n=3 Tax=Frankia nepalensis TaxID=1836974 RepID=A0A937URH4_9ACTN|nr:cation-translocating P-type ATPase [Frankia nepalensis]